MFERLADWIKAQGGTVNVDVGYSAAGIRGIVAAVDLKEGDPTIRLPAELAIRSGPRVLFPEWPELSDTQRLALFLLREGRRPDSFWRPYLDSLLSFDDYAAFHPLAQDAATRRLLREQLASEEAVFDTVDFPDIWLNNKKQPRFILYDADRATLADVEAHFPGFDAGFVFTRKEYVAALINALSRMYSQRSPSFEGFYEQGTGDFVMLPGHDMMNHRTFTELPKAQKARGRETTHYAEEALRVGDEINASYFLHDMCNEHILAHYGFLLPPADDEDHDCVNFRKRKVTTLLSANFAQRREAFFATMGEALRKIPTARDDEVADLTPTLEAFWQAAVSGEITVVGTAKVGDLDFIFTLFRLIVLGDDEFARFQAESSSTCRPGCVVEDAVNFRSEMAVLLAVLQVVQSVEAELHSFTCANWPFAYAPLGEYKRSEARAIDKIKRDLYDQTLYLLEGYPGNVRGGGTREEHEQLLVGLRDAFAKEVANPCVHLDHLRLP